MNMFYVALDLFFAAKMLVSIVFESQNVDIMLFSWNDSLIAFDSSVGNDAWPFGRAQKFKIWYAKKIPQKDISLGLRPIKQRFSARFFLMRSST